MLHWATWYIGKPWRSGADGPNAYDCWGLVRAVLRDRAGIDLPAILHGVDDHREIIADFAGHAELRNWIAVDGPRRDLDALLMAQARHPVHVGIWIAADHGRVLHAPRPMVVAQDIVSLGRHGYRVTATYRHKALV